MAHMLFGEPLCYLDVIAVHPDYRGYGYAAALIAALEETMRLAGYTAWCGVALEMAERGLSHAYMQQHGAREHIRGVTYVRRIS